MHSLPLFRFLRTHRRYFHYQLFAAVAFGRVCHLARHSLTTQWPMDVNESFNWKEKSWQLLWLCLTAVGNFVFSMHWLRTQNIRRYFYLETINFFLIKKLFSEFVHFFFNFLIFSLPLKFVIFFGFPDFNANNSLNSFHRLSALLPIFHWK